MSFDARKCYIYYMFAHAIFVFLTSCANNDYQNDIICSYHFEIDVS